MKNNASSIAKVCEKLQHDSVIFFGDSITADNRSNYVGLIIDEMEKHGDTSSIDIINSGVDSSNIFWVLDRLPEYLIEFDSRLITLFVGVNDSKRLRHVDKPLIPLDAFQYGLELFMERARFKWVSAQYVLVGLPPLCFDKIKTGNLLSEYWYWDKDEYKQYNSSIQEIAEKNNCSFVDLNAEFQKAEDVESLFYDDGVHPNIRGHRIIMEAWFDAVT